VIGIRESNWFFLSPITVLKGGIEMAEQDKSKNESGGQGGTPKESKTGDPGRTPGKAEGDEETADEALGSDDDNEPLH
jgi:hypothetical protein